MAGQHNTKNAALQQALTAQQPPVMPFVPPGQFIDIDERFYRGIQGDPSRESATAIPNHIYVSIATGATQYIRTSSKLRKLHI